MPSGSRRTMSAVLACVLSSSCAASRTASVATRSEEHTSELQSRLHLVCRLLLEKKNQTIALEFRENLQLRFLAPGASMGTFVLAIGVFINRCFCSLNLSLPALFRAVHQDYINS